MYATIVDLEKLRGAMSAAEKETATFLLEEASARLDVKVPSLAARVAGGQLDPVIPRGVVCRMVNDVLTNPDRFVSEQIEDAEYRYDLAALRSYMQPTDAEIADLSPSAGRRSRVGTIRIRCGW